MASERLVLFHGDDGGSAGSLLRVHIICNSDVGFSRKFLGSGAHRRLGGLLHDDRPKTDVKRSHLFVQFVDVSPMLVVHKIASHLFGGVNRAGEVLGHGGGGNPVDGQFRGVHPAWGPIREIYFEGGLGAGGGGGGEGSPGRATEEVVVPSKPAFKISENGALLKGILTRTM